MERTVAKEWFRKITVDFLLDLNQELSGYQAAELHIKPTSSDKALPRILVGSWNVNCIS